MIATDLLYYCPEFRSGHLQSPCDARLEKIQELQEKGQNYLGTLDKCQECQGHKLQERTVEEPQMAKEHKVEKGFCSDHPEEDHVILGPGRRPVAGKIPGKCKSCVEGKKAKTASVTEPDEPEEEAKATPPPPPEDPPAVPMCKTCGEAPAKIDSLGRNMGSCRKCLADRNRPQLEKGSKSVFAPFYLPLNDPRFAKIKQWLEAEAEEFVRDLPQEVMYRLKLAYRAATAEIP